MKAASIYPLRFLLMAICEKPQILTEGQRAAAGNCARRILEFALDQSPRENSLVRSGVESVCRTFESNPQSSEALLRRLLPEQSIRDYGYLDMPILAHEVGRLVIIAPALVRDVYIAAFGFDEEGTEQTSMGPGRIMPLTSNRRQDYSMAQWQLGEIFPSFLKHSPEQAVQALVAVVASEVESRPSAGTQYPEEAFDFFGSEARVRYDLSHIWDTTQYRQDAHLVMLDAFEAEIVRVGKEGNLGTSFDRILSAVVKWNAFAAVWRHMLSAGIVNSMVIGKKLSPLCWSLPILICHDTSQLAGEFIKVVYCELDESSRKRIENAILAIATIMRQDDADVASHIRDRLIGCIPKDAVVTEEAKRVLGDLADKGGAPKNHPPYQIRQTFGGRYTEEHFLADQGVPIQDSSNRRIRESAEPLQKFNAEHLNKSPTLTDTEKLVAQAQHLYDVVLAGVSSGAHQQQIDSGWSHLVSFCACAAKCEQIEADTEAGRLVKKILLEGAKDNSPTTTQHWIDQFDDHPSWSPAPRIDAAAGLLYLAHRPAFVDQKVLSTIESLSVDGVPAVRLQIADYLGMLTRTSPELMNRLLTNILTKDLSSSVVFGALHHQLWRLMPQQPEEVEAFTFTVLGRNDLKGKSAVDGRLYCVSILLNLHLWKGLPKSSAKVQEICSEVGLHLYEAARIVSGLREVLVVGSVEPSEPTCEAARLRAFRLLESIVGSAQQAFVELQESHKGTASSEFTQDEKERARRIVQLMDSVASQLFLASGAFDGKKANTADANSQPISLDQKRRFLKEAGKLLDLLTREPHPSIVHHLIQTLESLIGLNPRGVFLHIVSIAKSGKSGGYQYESLAVTLVVGIVNRIFADFRPVLLENQDVRIAMVEMLDLFVEAGWTQAIQLTYRLDEVFR